MPAADPRGIAAWAHDHEVVPGDLARVGSVALGDEALLGLGVVDQHQIGVAAGRRGQRLAGALGQDPHVDAGRVGERRQDALEEA